MRIISIPDLHGKNYWKDLPLDSYDKVVFLGDLIDSSKIESQQIVDNLQEIIAFKKSHPGKVVLLIGNHDMHYLHYPLFPCSGYDVEKGEELQGIFKGNADLFQFAYGIGNHMWTHAGLSQDWLEYKRGELNDYVKQDLLHELAEVINRAGEKNPKIVALPGLVRGGTEPYGGVIWADITEIKDSIPKAIHQYVGHNQVKDITTYGDENGSITFCDCLNTVKHYRVLELHEDAYKTTYIST